METKEIYTDWAVRKEPYEADERDFIAGNVLEKPKDYSKYRKTVSLTKIIKETINQWCIPKCTATSLCHIVAIQNALEEKTQDIFVDDEDQWTNNQWRPHACTGRGDYLETALNTLSKNWVSGKIRGKDFRYKIWWYAYDTWWKAKTEQQIADEIAFYLHNKMPLYMAMRWNKTIYNEISLGEWKTFITPAEADWWHATAVTGEIYVDWKTLPEEIEVTNSWRHNEENIHEEIKLSVFTIKRDLFVRLVRAWTLNWRYWVVYDEPNNTVPPLYVDYVTWEEPEHTEAVTFVKNSWFIKWRPSSNWPLFAPNWVVTRLELAIVIYRICMRVLKIVGK